MGCGAAVRRSPEVAYQKVEAGTTVVHVQSRSNEVTNASDRHNSGSSSSTYKAKGKATRNDCPDINSDIRAYLLRPRSPLPERLETASRLAIERLEQQVRLVILLRERERNETQSSKTAPGHTKSAPNQPKSSDSGKARFMGIAWKRLSVELQGLTLGDKASERPYFFALPARAGDFDEEQFRQKVRKFEEEMSREKVGKSDEKFGSECYETSKGLLLWDAWLLGPEGSPYEGGGFRLSIRFPETYPHSPPEVLFVTRCFHPNVDPKTGKICLNILKQEWSPILTVSSLLLSLSALLSAPAPSDALNEAAAELLRSDSPRFRSTARAWTQQHA